MSREKGLGGKVLDKPRSLLFQDGGENLCISLEDIGTGWKCKGSYQVGTYIGCRLIISFSPYFKKHDE